MTSDVCFCLIVTSVLVPMYLMCDFYSFFLATKMSNLAPQKPKQYFEIKKIQNVIWSPRALRTRRGQPSLHLTPSAPSASGFFGLRPSTCLPLWNSFSRHCVGQKSAAAVLSQTKSSELWRPLSSSGRFVHKISSTYFCKVCEVCSPSKTNPSSKFCFPENCLQIEQISTKFFCRPTRLKYVNKTAWFTPLIKLA